MPPASPPDEIARGREAYGRKAWAEAHRWFLAADGKQPLEVAELECFAWSAILAGRDEDCLALLERLHQLHMERDEPLRAARWAFWLGFRLGAMREFGRASGWLSRAHRLTENVDCVEKGYLHLPEVLRRLSNGDREGACVVAAAAARIGDHFRDAGLSAHARCLEGMVRMRSGQVDAGLALLDEAMVAVTAGDVAPVPSGLIYCTAIAACSQVYVMDRVREWTAALSGWCAGQPELVPFSGTCLVHRAELMQLSGSWREAMEEARRAGETVRKIDLQANADSFYQQGEVHRLRGDFSDAEQAYRRATEFGREAQPGMALLRLAQGRTADAVSAIRGALHTATDRLHRARLLPAAVEIALEAGDVEDARTACAELERIAADVGTEVLRAMAAHASGAVELAEGRAEVALEPLRRAFRVWHEVGAPYIAARLRVLIARACRALGDQDTARLELELAREVFQRLGAVPELARLGDDEGGGRAVPARLSPRELEVLRLVASGKTNKAIARELGVSEKTVDRHVSNIFAKTSVNSRAAATAFAYRNRLV